jgi:DNA-binding FadR family transcriptional regulator
VDCSRINHGQSVLLASLQYPSPHRRRAAVKKVICVDVLEASRNLAHQVTHALGRAIVQGKYSGDHVVITEAELSEQFKISRTVTREAVKMLSAKGLLSSRQRRGITVAPCSQWNMFDEDVLSWTLSTKPSLQLLREFAQLRLAIEPEAAVLACDCQDAEKLLAIEFAANTMLDAQRNGESQYESDIAFHTAIFLATENRFFVQFRSFIQAALRVSIMWNFQIKGNIADSADEHAQVFHCIKKGNREGARNAMRGMLEENLQLIDAAIARENPLAIV